MCDHHTPGGTALIKKTGENKCGCGCGEKGTLCTVYGNVNRCSHYGKQYGTSSKNKIGLPHDSAIPLVSIYLKKAKTLTPKDGGTQAHDSMSQQPSVTARGPGGMTGEGDVLRAYSGMFSSLKEGDPAACDNMDGPRVYHAKERKLEKDSSTRYHICGI